MSEFRGGDEVIWTGSRLAAPGPGTQYRPFGTGPLVWDLFGEVLRVSPSDPQSVTVRWENGRVTIERASNIAPVPLIAIARTDEGKT